MAQEIITYIILAATAIFIAYKLFFNKTEKSKSCGGCEASCSGCELSKLKEQIEIARNDKIHVIKRGNLELNIRKVKKQL
jgi:hypothetical protein